MTRRTIILGLASSLISLPLSLAKEPFLADPEEVAQRMTEWSLQGDLERVVELYDPEDIETFKAVVLTSGDLLAPYGEPFPLADAGLNLSQARELTPRQFMLKSLASMFEMVRRARKEYTIDIAAEVSDKTVTSATVTVRTEVRLTPAQAKDLGSFASLVERPRETVYAMRRERGRWYVRFDERMHTMVSRTQTRIAEFEARAGRDQPSPETASEPQRFKRIGYSDENLRTIIEPRFADGKSFSEGVAAVQIDDHWGFIDPTGRAVIPARFTDARSFESGLAAVRNEDKVWGYINLQGHMAIEPQFDAAREFSEGLAAVKKDDMWGYINTSGALVIPCRYGYACQFSGGRAEVMTFEGEEIRVDRTGEAVTDSGSPAPIDPPSADADTSPTTELICFELIGYRDATGRTLIEPRFPAGHDFHEGLASVQFFYRWGFIDRTGRTVVAPQYQRARDFSEGLAAVETIDDIWGFVDRTGRTIVAPKYQSVRAFSEGLAAVQLERLWGFIDPTGTVVIPIKFSDAGDFADGQAQVTLPPDDHAVIIDHSGRVVIHLDGEDA